MRPVDEKQAIACTVQIRFERMRVGFRSSPFFMETGGPAQRRVDKSVPDVTRYLDPECLDKPETRRPLHEVCSLRHTLLLRCCPRPTQAAAAEPCAEPSAESYR